MAPIELQLPTDVVYVGLARLVVTTAARQAGMEEARVEDLKIAVSEATTNVILARQQTSGDDPVVLAFEPRERQFEVIIRDAGPVVEQGGPDGESDLDSRGWTDESGLGVTVIRGLTDDVDFVRDSEERVHMRFAVDLRDMDLGA